MGSIKRHRKLFSVKEELLHKSREAALAAVQIFNNPSVTFKSETYIVLMVIAWTYLLHAYYRVRHIEYRYFSDMANRKKFNRTKNGAFKYWELERCLDDKKCPLAPQVIQNLFFLIKLRHEIEHQMTTRIDDLLSARFQACCINFHDSTETLFGKKYGIAGHLAVSLQFSAIGKEQINSLNEIVGLPAHIKSFITGFDGNLDRGIFESPKFAYRVIYVPKIVNHASQADQVITFVKADSSVAKDANAAYTVIRETERPKWLPSQIVKLMKEEGFSWFSMTQHTELWQKQDAKNVANGLGVLLVKTWYWYDSWVGEVRKHCIAIGNKK